MPAGSLFTAGGQTLRRAVMKTETTGRVWAEDTGTGKRRDLTFEEHRGFWCWAMIEVLRNTGCFSRGQIRHAGWWLGSGRFRCAGCDHFRTDVSCLPDLTAYLDDLLRVSAFARHSTRRRGT